MEAGEWGVTRWCTTHAHKGMDNEGLAADYEYVCFGKVYKFDEGKQEIACVQSISSYSPLTRLQHSLHLIRWFVAGNYWPCTLLERYKRWRGCLSAYT